MKEKISAVMTVFNERGHIELFFKSFLDQTFDPNSIELVIVDNCSNDGTGEIISMYQKYLSKLKLIKIKCNRSKGRNIAIKNTSGEYILTFNSDIYMESNCIEELIKAIKRYPEAGGIAATQLYPKNQNFLAKCIYIYP